MTADTATQPAPVAAREYYFVITVLTDGGYHTTDGTLSVSGPATRHSLYERAVALLRKVNGIPGAATLVPLFFTCEPNDLA